MQVTFLLYEMFKTPPKMPYVGRKFETVLALYNMHFLCLCLCRLSSLPTYYIPKDGSMQTYREYINQLPNVDHPEAFGQHTNADIASQIKETRLANWIPYLQPSS